MLNLRLPVPLSWGVYASEVVWIFAELSSAFLDDIQRAALTDNMSILYLRILLKEWWPFTLKSSILKDL